MRVVGVAVVRNELPVVSAFVERVRPILDGLLLLDAGCTHEARAWLDAAAAIEPGLAVDDHPAGEVSPGALWTYLACRLAGSFDHLIVLDPVAVPPHRDRLDLDRALASLGERRCGSAGDRLYAVPLALARAESFQISDAMLPAVGGEPAELQDLAGPGFTAILLSWKRVHNLPTIVEGLRQIRYIREIIVWNNDPSRPLALPEVTVVNAPENYKCLARYCMVPLARHDHIWFQDDDLLITPEQFDTLLQHHVANPDQIVGCRGRNVVDGKYTWDDAYGPVDIVLGQTMMFHRRLLWHAFEALGELTAPTVDDDIAFSLSCKRKHIAVNVEPIRDLGMSDAAALWQRPEHAGIRQSAVERYSAWLRSAPGPA